MGFFASKLGASQGFFSLVHTSRVWDDALGRW